MVAGRKLPCKPGGLPAVKAVLGAPPPNGLGASFTNYDANDRSEQLKVRQNFARDKYVFW